jgi:hypothetical protein
MKSPYADRPAKSFWRSGVAEQDPPSPGDLYARKFEIAAGDGIATAGSCFAQHVGRHLRANGFSVLDAEPAPEMLPEEQRKEFGYGLYSARTGNIYTARQLLELARDAKRGFADERHVWTKDGRYYDALRPGIERQGFETLEEALELRRDHLAKVRRLFTRMNVFVFTLGLTEGWADKQTGRVFPAAPGTIAGEYDPSAHVFVNFSYEEIRDDLLAFRDLVRRWNPGLRILLTVSPVPLTATATDDHVLAATTYSKSVLRAVAGKLAKDHEDIDYFPSYEIVTNPWSKERYYEANQRSVSAAGVEAVMRVFFAAHPVPEKAEAAGESKAERRKRRLEERAARRGRRDADEAEDEDEAVCEDALLEGFRP